MDLQLLTISLLVIPTLILFNLFSRDKSDTTLLKMVNEKRVENAVSPVIYSKKLGQSSTRKACDMKINNYFSHFSPNGLLWEFFTNVDYHYKLAGEDLAKDCIDEDCLALWMLSPKHREIILDPRYKEGAVSRCGEYLVLHFGTRLSLKEIMQMVIIELINHPLLLHFLCQIHYSHYQMFQVQTVVQHLPHILLLTHHPQKYLVQTELILLQ